MQIATVRLYFPLYLRAHHNGLLVSRSDVRVESPKNRLESTGSFLILCD